MARGAHRCCRGLRDTPVPSSANPPASTEPSHKVPTSRYQNPLLQVTYQLMVQRRKLPRDVWAPSGVVTCSKKLCHIWTVPHRWALSSPHCPHLLLRAPSAQGPAKDSLCRSHQLIFLDFSDINSHKHSAWIETQYFHCKIMPINSSVSSRGMEYVL